MAKKRKRSSDAPATVEQPDDSAPPRPERTLFGLKDQPAAEPASGDGEAAAPPFRNKEKVLVTCSRRIIYRYRHLMQNMVSLLPHAKKDSKVESKQSKGNALNELLELRSCSSCLFFEAVIVPDHIASHRAVDKISSQCCAHYGGIEAHW